MTTGRASGAPAHLSELLAAVNAAEESPHRGGIPLRINFLRNFTVEGIEPFLKYRCLSDGLAPTVVFGNYDMVRQEILDQGSHLHTTDPDIIVVALHLETLVPDCLRTEWNAREVMNELNSLYGELERSSDAIIAVNSFIPPFHPDLGITSSPELPSRYHEVLLLNQLVRDFVRSNQARFVLVDWERILRIVGEDESIDYRFWYMSKAPFKKRFLDQYALELTKIARALKGKAKKCLVLDCDNTLWGGIIGEDGLQGIKLDRHSYPGNVYYEFQQRVLNLFDRGVLLALCSKNNEQDVWDLLDNHPHCLIKREHLAAWRVNWLDKASNLKELARSLNLGLDSFVFVDDNPAECGLVRDLLPEVTVLQVPEKIYTYPRLLEQHGLFDTLTLSSEDRQRSRMYREDIERKSEQAHYETVEQYLASLAIAVTVHRATDREIPRVAQLTQKTNQFNLTTRRYTEAQIAAFASDPAYAVLTLAVRDKFGDSGLTGVLIAHNDGNVGTIDTLLLSCRILGRTIEIAFVLKSLELMERLWKIDLWRGEYIPTAKNQQVAGFWQLMGFTETGRDGDLTLYQLARQTPRRDTIPYIVIEEG